MAIINNTLSEVGDVLNIRTQLAIRGKINLTGFTDNVQGETPTRFFTKTFKYSFDNINWSNVIPLSVSAIQSISGSVPGLLFMEFQYERVGNDTDGILEFNSIEIVGNIDIQICIQTATLDSIFEDIACNNYMTQEIANNLLRKIYYSGILPKFIERGESNEDEDFITFWSAVCFMMAMLISFMDTFDEILYHRKNLTEYLQQKGLAISGRDTILDELQFLANNYKDEIRKRGTFSVVREKGETTSYGETVKIRGEWLRLIAKNHWDEFLFEVMEQKHMGFNLDNSSPMYNGTNRSTQLNKTPENSELFYDLSLYETEGNVSLEADNTVSIKGHSGGFSGFGKHLKNDIESYVDLDSLIAVEKEMDYEITFQIKKSVDTVGVMPISFGVLGFNRNGIFLSNSFSKISLPQSQNNIFFENLQIDEITKVKDVWYNVRGILYAGNSIGLTNDEARLNINKGVNLRFNYQENIEYVKICLYSESTNATRGFEIKDLKMRPLVRGKSVLAKNIQQSNQTTNIANHIKFSSDRKSKVENLRNPHFIQQGNTIMCWMKNNNDNKTDNQVANFIEKFLIPYQQKLVGVFLEPKIDDKQLLT